MLHFDLNPRIPQSARDEEKTVVLLTRHGTVLFQVKRLKKKLRKEERGASRELRRDASFIARTRLEENAKLDAKLQKRTNEAMAFLEKQEQTWKQQERKKRKATGKW